MLEETPIKVTNQPWLWTCDLFPVAMMSFTFHWLPPLLEEPLMNVCSGEWRHIISVTMKTTTKRLIIHEAESTHKYHHKYPLEIHSTRKKHWSKRLTKHLENLKKTLVKLQVISRWPRARQCRGPVRMLLIHKGVSPLVRIPAVTTCILKICPILFRTLQHQFYH